jgi:cell division protein FtsB
MKGRVQTKNLRQQVKFERKRRNTIFFTIVTLAFFYIAAQLVLGDMGFLKYTDLIKTKSRLSTEITDLEKENKTLKKQITAFKDDNFYIEKYAREEYGLAKPGEYIFQFKDDGR